MEQNVKELEEFIFCVLEFLFYFFIRNRNRSELSMGPIKCSKSPSRERNLNLGLEEKNKQNNTYKQNCTYNTYKKKRDKRITDTDRQTDRSTSYYLENSCLCSHFIFY